MQPRELWAWDVFYQSKSNFTNVAGKGLWDGHSRVSNSYVAKRCILLELIDDMYNINANFNQNQDNNIKQKAML